MRARHGRHQKQTLTLSERLGAVVMLIGIFGGPAIANALIGR